MNINLKSKEGISLISLVVTIIVVIILATISINGVMDEGLIGSAGRTKLKVNRDIAEYTLNQLLLECDISGKRMYEFFIEKQEEGKIDSIEDKNEGFYVITIGGNEFAVEKEDGEF